MIKQKGKSENCIGVDRRWWGTGATSRSWPNFQPNPLIVTKCAAHVSEHNNSFLMPSDVNGSYTGLIVWTTHPEMCLDLQDHEEEIKREQEGDLLQVEKRVLTEIRTKRMQDSKLASKSTSNFHRDEHKEEPKNEGEQNVRTFDGNIVTLAPCTRIGNWTIQSTMPLTLTGLTSLR